MRVSQPPLLLLASLFLPVPSGAQAKPADTLPTYTRQDVMIPMRDGVSLHAAILRPADMPGPLPFLMTRTPYGVAGATAAGYPKQNPELAKSGYIFVEEDIRGRYGSGGTFVMMRPLAAHHDAKLYPQDVDESTDAYDTVAWLLTHVPGHNGRVGVFGVSYPGFLTMEAGIDPHPAVKAISPQAPMTDVWLGDDFFHNGAFRETYGYDYALGMESSKENSFRPTPAGGDEYDYFLKAGSFAGAIQKSGTPDLPTWQAFLAHPAYDSYWQARAVEPHLNTADVPTLEVGGYWDQEDMWGPQEEYARLHANDKADQIRLVLGPWNHGEWRRAASSLGALDWGEPTGSEFQHDIEAPFFAHYLKGHADESAALASVSSFQTGTDRWMHYAAWPPTNGIEQKQLYLGSGGTLAFAIPTVAEDAKAFAEYTADPAHPIPYRARPIEATYAPSGSHWYTWLAEDQRPYTSRPDQLTWHTAPLTATITLTGNVDVDLWASTSGTDGDWIVKLIDEYPDSKTDPKLDKMASYQLMVAEEIFRGRYRKSFENPEPISAHTPLEYKWSLHAVDHAFLPGHRMLVEVQSSWFPLYDRNPQRFVPNIMTAQPSDYQAATERIFWSTAHPSHLTVPVVESRSPSNSP
jgi:putative CocE/NonD family hydrolase